MADRLLIVGASVRAAASSALRAGIAPVGIDLFADLDLSSICEARRVDPDGYPEGLERAALGMPRGPWMYVGALENHPAILDRIAGDRPLWGNGGEVMRRVRDPVVLAEVIRGAGLPSLEVRTDPAGLPRDGSWLIKRVRSAGGLRIRALDDRGPGPVEGADYLQRRAVGPSGSAVFVGFGGSARLRGVTRQWIGGGGEPFGYLGSVGPVRVSPGVRRQLRRLGEVLAAEFGLVGLFGVDFVLSGGRAWPTEVNPRYSASVEVLEGATGRSLLREHAGVFGYEGHVSCSDHAPSKLGKVVVYANDDGGVPRSIRWPLVDPRSGRWPSLADLPEPGTTFRAGRPVLTLLQGGETASVCRDRLIARLARWRARLRSWADGGPGGR